MKKKILALTLCVAMLAVAVVGGTLAYFTDTDQDVNTMVSGSIEIRQDEWMRDEDGENLVEYEDQTLLPAVIYDEDGKPTSNWGASAYVENTDVQFTVEGLEDTFLMPDSDRMRNVVDKVVTVTNTGNNDAYIRTILLIEDTNSNVIPNLEMLYDSSLTPKAHGYMTVNNTQYYVFEFTYADKVAPKETTLPSAMAFWMNPSVDQDVVPDEFNIIAYSQAVQADGFDNAQTALDTAFGAVSAEKLASTEWGVVFEK